MSALPSKPIPETIEDNTVEFFLNLGRVNGSEVCDNPAVKYVFTGSGFNRIMRARFSTSIADRIVRRIVARLDTRGIDALWYITPASTSGLPTILEQHGFFHRSDWMSMALNLSTFSGKSEFPSRLEIREANDNKDLDTWAKVAITSYNLDDELRRASGRHLITPSNTDNFRCHYFFGLLDNKPVATAALFEGEDAAGIYWVGTLPEARKRGIANAMTQHALLKAKTCGYKIAILNASEQGHSIYQQIGFTDYYTTNIYYRESAFTI
ncbi:MAG TPA: GNAT family N-acetyltransferase [Methanosarcina sp.]|nr:GNAT family N-acetyltransferase [Methanosarcina sp.]